MFPASPETWTAIALLTIWSVITGLVAWRGWPRRWIWGTALAVAVLWPWPLAAYTNFYIYAVQAALVASAVSVMIVGLAGLIGLGLRRWLPPLVAIALALSPMLVGVPFALERQRIPNAPCAERALFALSDITLSVPRDMSAVAVTPHGQPPADWAGSYYDWPGIKPDVRAYCRASEGGTVPVELPHLSLSVAKYRNDLRARCSSGAETGGLCDAVADSALTVIQFYVGTPPRPVTSRGHFSQSKVLDAINAGQSEGIICPAANQIGERWCTIWTTLRPDLMTVTTLHTKSAKTEAELLQDGKALIQGLIAWLAP